MSVGSPLSTLLKSNFRAWVSAKGFWLVLVAALVPMGLTAAWVGGHQADVWLKDFEITDAPHFHGEPVVFRANVVNNGGSAIPEFTVNWSVIDVGSQFQRVVARNTTTVNDLQVGETRAIEFSWNGTNGIFVARVHADEPSGPQLRDSLGERDEYNNFDLRGFSVGIMPQGEESRPSAPAGIAGNETAETTTDLSISFGAHTNTTTGANVSYLVVERDEGTTEIVPPNVTFRATIKNNGDTEVVDPILVLRVGESVGRRLIGTTDAIVPTNLTLAPGAEQEIAIVEWPARIGAFWLEGYVQPPEGMRDTNGEDNYVTAALAVNPPDEFEVPIPEDLRPEPLQTVKDFYMDILDVLHLRIVLPLVALFYAAGVLADEKERGALPYLLTRPIPRWMIPITKFVASFLVASVAAVVGVALMYAFLFGSSTNIVGIGYLTTPLFLTLLTLFAYGGAFTLLGTLITRPYLVGLLFVLGWEVIVFQFFAPWAGNLTITQHVTTALRGVADDPQVRETRRDGWRLDQGLEWLPVGDEAMRGVLMLLAIGAGALVLAAGYMRKREFPVG